jgi:O-methyltransferase involved in polyketide biosynthesis
MVVFEVDHPATQARKRKAIGTLPERVRYIPVDFEHDPLPPAQAFFAARKLTLRHDESTTAAAVRLGIASAQSIPNFYRLATLEVNTRP